MDIGNSKIHIEQVYDDEMPHLFLIRVSHLPVGFGQTCGNVLRRTLLSSSMGGGYAIWAVRLSTMDGVVPHPYTSIPGVREDYLSLLVNFRGVNMTVSGDDVEETNEGGIKLVLSDLPQGVVYASMLKCPSGVTVINGDHYLFTIVNANVNVNVECLVNTGQGCVTADEHDVALSSILPAGFITIDTKYNPVERVSFEVKHGQERGKSHEILFLTVATNGVFPIKRVLSQAAKLVVQIIAPFYKLIDGSCEGLFSSDSVDNSAEIRRKELHMLFNKPIAECDFSVRTDNCLKDMNIVYLGELVSKTKSELLSQAHFGKKSFEDVLRVMDSYGLELGMDVLGWKKHSG